MRKCVWLLALLAGCGGGGGGASTATIQTLFLHAPDPLSADPTPTFEFSSHAADVRYECSLDGGPFEPVPNPHTLDRLADGTHRVEVCAIDTAGEREETPPAYEWTVDTHPPQIAITFPPPVCVVEDSIAVCGTAADANAIAEVVVNGVPAKGTPQLTSWRAVVPITGDRAEVRVECRDAAGNSLVDTGPTVFRRAPVLGKNARDLVAVRGIAYYLDGGNLLLRSIDLATGDTTVLSGGGVGAGATFLQPRAMTATSDGAALLVFDSAYCRLFRVPLATGDRTILLEGLNVAPNNSDIGIDAYGRMCCEGETLYILGGHRFPLAAVDLVTLSWAMLTEHQFTFPAGMGVDSARNRLVVAATCPDQLFSVDLTTGAVAAIGGAGASTPDTGAALGRPLVLDGEHAYWIAPDNHGMLEVDLATGGLTSVPVSGELPQFPTGMVLDDDRLLLLDRSRSSLLEVPRDGGTIEELFPAQTPWGDVPDLLSAGDVRYDAATGRVFVSDPARATLFAIDLETAERTAVAALAASAFDIDAGAGKVAAVGVGTIEVVDLRTGQPLSFPWPAAAAGPPLGLSLERDGRSAYVADARDIYRVNLDDGSTNIVASNVAAYLEPTARLTGAIAWSGSRLFVGVRGEGWGLWGSILDVQFSPAETTVVSGWLDTVASSGVRHTLGSGPDLGNPTRIAHDPIGKRLLVVDSRWHGILEVDETGSRSMFSGPDQAGPQIVAPRWIAVAPEKGLAFVADDRRVLAVDLHTGDRVIIAE